MKQRLINLERSESNENLMEDEQSFISEGTTYDESETLDEEI